MSRLSLWQHWLASVARRASLMIFLLALTSAQVFATGSVRNVFEFGIPPGSHPYVGEYQSDKNPVWHVGNFLIDGRVVGTWDISQAGEAQRVFRTEVIAQPGQTISVGVIVTRTNYPPMTVTVKSKAEDTVWQVDWFIDSINVAGSKPMGTPAPAPVSPTGDQESPPGSGETTDGIESIGPLKPINFNMRRRWIVREHRLDGGVWEGVWVRRGNSNTFDATWRLGGVGSPIQDKVTVRGIYDGDIVEVHRQGNDGIYRGMLTGDKLGVSRGTASWYTGEWWEARFVDGVDAPATPADDGRGSTPGEAARGGVSRMAGSHLGSTQVYCLRGSETYINNWVRSCVLVGDQTFNRITFRNPGLPPTTEPVLVRTGVRASFDEYGYLVTR